jgi:hypothetical protein
MDQHFPKVHDLNVALFRSPELPLGQGTWSFLSSCFHIQLFETLSIRSRLNTAFAIPLRLTWRASVAGSICFVLSDIGNEAAGFIH